MAQIGEPDEYIAWVKDSKTQEPLIALPWASINWQRCRNRVSVGSVTIAEADGGIECCREIGGLATWSQMLAIERDGTTVWDGPIQGWNRSPITAPNSPRGVTVKAKDRFGLTQHRLCGADRKMPTYGTNNIIYTANMQQLLDDAGIGNPTFDPYPFFLPRFPTGLIGIDTGYNVPNQPQQAEINVTDVWREVFADRLERVFDVIDDLATHGGMYYCMVADRLHMNEMLVRAWLDDARPPPFSGPDFVQNYDSIANDRPVLNDLSTIGIPGVDVDGMRQATDYYVVTAGQGENGFPEIGTANVFGHTYVRGRLEIALGNDRATTQRDELTEEQQLAAVEFALAVVAQYGSVEAATPQLTIEQVRLSPTFGSEAMLADLSNLLPGALFDIDFDSTCAFDVPMSIMDYWFRPINTDNLDGPDGYWMTPLLADSVRSAKLEQIDVKVSNTNGLEEEILVSLTPWADWNGHLPADWLEPSYFHLGY